MREPKRIALVSQSRWQRTLLQRGAVRGHSPLAPSQRWPASSAATPAQTPPRRKRSGTAPARRTPAAPPPPKRQTVDAPGIASPGGNANMGQEIDGAHTDLGRGGPAASTAERSAASPVLRACSRARPRAQQHGPHLFLCRWQPRVTTIPHCHACVLLSRAREQIRARGGLEVAVRRGQLGPQVCLHEVFYTQFHGASAMSTSSPLSPRARSAAAAVLGSPPPPPGGVSAGAPLAPCPSWTRPGSATATGGATEPEKLPAVAGTPARPLPCTRLLPCALPSCDSCGCAPSCACCAAGTASAAAAVAAAPKEANGDWLCPPAPWCPAEAWVGVGGWPPRRLRCGGSGGRGAEPVSEARRAFEGGPATATAAPAAAPSPACCALAAAPRGPGCWGSGSPPGNSVTLRALRPEGGDPSHLKGIISCLVMHASNVWDGRLAQAIVPGENHMVCVTHPLPQSRRATPRLHAR